MEPVTRPFTITLQDERTPPWLISAFIVLFGVTLAAAMPAIAAAASGKFAAASSERLFPERIVVRAKIKVFRAVQPKAPDGHDLIQITLVNVAPLPFGDERVTPRPHDPGAEIASRGIRIRAPPIQTA